MDEKEIILCDSNVMIDWINHRQKAINDLKLRLNQRENELRSLREEKEHLETIIREQNNDLIEKTNQINEMAMALDHYKMMMDPTAGEYNKRIQEMLVAQQKEHEDALLSIKTQVHFTLIL